MSPSLPSQSMRGRYVDLFDVLPDANPCYDVPGYGAAEREQLTPALEAAGYEVHGDWRTGDGDSFGPLTRYVSVTAPSGERFRVIYG